ncbi:type VII secretion protein EssC [Lachnobacterium bovis]|uniref:type VII secretion protein EssC n=1 Tax=Lachnobacterium bovis TaxID=140626 RepID=UPI0003B38CED|nr:type VII secretion protein EssC [Lachnobacterium bovis]
MKYIYVDKNNRYEEYPVNDDEKIEEGQLFFTEEYKAYTRKEKVFISGNLNSDIYIPECGYKILLDEGKLFVEHCKSEQCDSEQCDSEQKIYLDQVRIKPGEYKLENGSIILLPESKIKLVIGKDYIKVFGQNYKSALLETDINSNRTAQFPIYKRSPRIVKRIKEETIRVTTPLPNNYKNRNSLLQIILPPLGMLAVTIAMGIMINRGIYMIVSGMATVMTSIFSVVRFFQDKKDNKETEKTRQKIFAEYLLKKRKEIYAQWQKEKDAYEYNYPTLDKIEEMVNDYSNRIYERTSIDDDFLTISIGHYYGDTTFKIENNIDELALNSDEFVEDGKKLKFKFSKMDKPQIINIRNAHLGLVGEKSVIHEQLKNYVTQLTFEQSYHDVEFIAIYDERYDKDFSWMRWFKHFTIHSINSTGLIKGERQRDQVMTSMQQILKERKQKLEESKKESKFLPHYIFIIDEPSLIMDHSIMEYLGGDLGKELGFTLIYTSNQQANLPENIGTVVLLENSNDATLLIEEKEYKNREIQLYETTDINYEMLARNLGVLVHEQGITNNIPESITFLDMYGVKTPEELGIANRWEKNNSSKTLSVPLGVRGEDDIVELNLHEKAHGPHGLVAGTTGSGKSEIVQSYILSLAINFHPYEVGFLLIDYKGGGMANLFKNLPHLMGTITNLDGSESMRALYSIKSELKRRESIFREHEVNHINAYNDLFKQGKAKEPIPHLFIISDEFAELKKEQPEFMKELVSTARVGRSLGVHLILATQKPSGVVDEQIWSNSKFKLCLKVQNESDSNEVLHTADAANITQTGRAILQVGNNEIYEMFQSAWSGAKYMPTVDQEVSLDNRVYLINEFGQGQLLNQDLRGSIEEQKANKTQLEVIVDCIHDTYEKQLNYMREKIDMAAIDDLTKETLKSNLIVRRPWLPSLTDKIVNPLICEFEAEAAGISKEEEEATKDLSELTDRDVANLEISYGVVDIPEKQTQEEYKLDLSKEGNVVNVTSSGYGKSVMLTNVALQLAIQNSVENLNMYILDFGNNSLIALKRLPHVAEHIMIDETEKFNKFRELMLEEMKIRKKALAKAVVQNFVVYNENAREKGQKQLKAIVILVDNYDVIKEMGFEMEDYFTKLTRDGVGLGIYTIIAANRENAIRYATLNNFKNKIAGFNFDINEAKAFIGRSKYVLPEIKGRAMVKIGEKVEVMQMYTPVDFTDDVDYGKKLVAKINEIREVNPNMEAPHIPILPEDLMYDEFISEYINPILKQKEEMPKVTKTEATSIPEESEGTRSLNMNNRLFIGLREEDVQPIEITHKDNPFMVMGDGACGKTNALKVLIKQLIGKVNTENLYIFDSRKKDLYQFFKESKYIKNTEEFENFADRIKRITNDRSKIIQEKVDKGDSFEEAIDEFDPIYVIIDDLDDFAEFAGSDLDIVAGRMEKSISVGVKYIVSVNSTKLKTTDIFSRAVKGSGAGVLVGSQGYLTIFPVKVSEKIDISDGFVMCNCTQGRVRIPQVD